MMRNNFIRVLIITILFSCTLTSCYNTRIAVGDASPEEAMIKVKSQRNHFLLGGLIPLNNTRSNASDFIGNKEDYIIKTNISFVNGLVSFFTLNFYSPTTTTYYLPLDKYLSIYGNQQSEDNADIYKAAENKQKKKNNQQRTARQEANQESEKRYYKRPVSETRPAQPYLNKNTESDNNTVTTTSYQQQPAKTKDYRATIYYKNGAKMDGIVTESPNSDKVRIKLSSGLLVESKISDIEQIEMK